MIAIIGTRRLFILGALVAVNAVMAAATYLYLIPDNEKTTKNLSSTKAEISSKQSDTERLRNEYDLILKQKAAIEDLKATGFLEPQDRVLARDRIEAIQAHSRVLRANYTIEPVRIEENAEAAKSNQVILSSMIKTDIDALDDLDFMNFVYWLENGFMGQVTVTNIELQRVNDVNDVTLRQIGTGAPVAIVKGKVDFEWRTMVPRDDAASNLTTERF